MTAKTSVIYVLIDPRTHEARYVGKAFNHKKRMTAHLRDRRPSLKMNWLQSLMDAGLNPIIEVLEHLGADTTKANWQEAERFWISYLKFSGAELTNMTGGGEGMSGHIPTSDHKKKISDANKGKIVSIESRAHMADAQRRRFTEHPEQLLKLHDAHRATAITDDTRRKIAATLRGRIFSPEHRARIGDATRRRMLNPAVREHIGAANRGKIISPETRLKMSKAKRGRKLSIEHRRKISEAGLGRERSTEPITRITGCP